jgi:uncharacterized DUF497 family protein
MDFTWDNNKERLNVRKHGLDFTTATRVFLDPFALIEQNRIENSERRWQTIGLVDSVRVLLVGHTLAERDDGTELVRIITARAADPKERKRYDENRLQAGF